MRRYEFILRMRELGYADEQIAEVILQHEQDSVQKGYRPWQKYLPDQPPPRPRGRPKKNQSPSD